jgi:CRISPR-associated endonuclease/helicase Cas3
VRNLYFQYWGKARPTSDLSHSYHPLVYHSLDVAAVGRELICHYRPCIKISENLGMDREVFADIFAFFLSLHDIGKFAASFQYLVPKLPAQLIGENKNQPYKYKVYDVRHDALGYFLWQQKLRKYSFSELDWEISDQNYECVKDIFDQWMQIVTGHHGVPPRMKHQKKQIDLLFNEIDIEAAKNFLLAIKRLPFFPQKLPTEFSSETFKEIFQESSWLLNGTAILADWMGSDQNVFNYFTDPMSLEEYWNTHALRKAKESIKKTNLIYRIQAQPFKNAENIFSTIKTLTPLQKYCSEVELFNSPQLFILEDVTGSGKTEAAFILAQRLMAMGLADGIYIGLPTMATANSMYNRTSSVYKKLFSADSEPSLVLAHSKNYLYRPLHSAIHPSDINYKSDEETASHEYNHWFADNRKKALLADIGVGTLDQALVSVLPVKHQTLRQLGLINKILIADEIHAYDEYTGTLLKTLLESHARRGGSAIILSATISQKMHRQLVSAFQKGLGIRKKKEDYLLLKNFPLATHVGEKIQETSLETRKICQRKVNVQMLTDELTVYQIIQQAVAKGQCVCWIRNTVKGAITSYKALIAQPGINPDNVRLFHSQFAMIDRLRIEQEVINHFGPSSTGKFRSGQVLIATQVVEQSLDLDFDVLISDLAPIDLLIQRAGRLHRHVRNSSGDCVKDGKIQSGRQLPIFYIFGPPLTQEPGADWLKEILPGTSAVYPHVGRLWLTQQWLGEEKSFEMPRQARQMIESIYDDKLSKCIPVNLEKLSGVAEGEQSCNRSQANFNCVDISRGYCDESANHGGWGEEINTPTRLGDEMQEIILVIAGRDQCHAYADVKIHPWDMSTLSLRTVNCRKLKNFTPQIVTQLESLKKQELTLKNYSILIPLIPGENQGEYFIYNQNSQIIAHYSHKFGFQFEE